MKLFVVDGFLKLNISDELPLSFHRQLHRKAERLWNMTDGQAGVHFGNNIFPVLPDLNAVLRSPAVRGALTSVLGEDYALHAHRFMHVSTGESDQALHKDGLEGHGPMRFHRPR
jgi:hypothetical protein